MRAHRRAAGHEPGAGRRAAGRAGPCAGRDASRPARRCWRAGSTCPGPRRWRRWRRRCSSASARRTSSSTTPGSAPAACCGRTASRDWEWVLGVNLWGVVHGVRLFTPMMLAAAKADPHWRGHIVNTASMAGLLTPPNMGIYNVSKHAVVSLTETLYQDLRLVTDQVGASVLCPYFVPTGINQSERNRPGELARRPADQEPADRPGHERQGGQLRQGHGRRGGAEGVRRRGGRPVLRLQPPQGAGQRAQPDGGHRRHRQSARSLPGAAGAWACSCARPCAKAEGRAMAAAAGCCLFDTAIGRCGIAWRADGAIAAVQLPETTDARTLARLRRWCGPAGEVASAGGRRQGDRARAAPAGGRARRPAGCAAGL